MSLSDLVGIFFATLFGAAAGVRVGIWMPERYLENLSKEFRS